MPVEHLVLLKLRDLSASDVSALTEANNTLRRLPGVTHLSHGPNYTARGQGYTYGIAVRFVSKEAEATYQTHPEHVRVRDEVLKPLLASGAPAPILAIDYEFGTAEPAAGGGSDAITKLLEYNTPQVSNVVATYPGAKHCLGLYNPWTMNWYTDTSVRAVCGLEHEQRRCGYAVTCVSALPDAGYEQSGPQWGDVLEAIEASPKPVVLILEQRYPPEIAKKVGLVGGNMATHMKRLGCVGVISNGPQRDADEIRAMGGIGCIASGLTPGHGKMAFQAVNIPVSVAGMDVSPGEVVHMDEHGAVKLPPGKLGEVAEHIAQLQAEEDATLARVRAAGNVEEVRRAMEGAAYSATGRWRGGA